MTTNRVDTVAARARLAPRREPYWHRVAAGRYLGLRKMSPTSEGSWQARAMVESTGRPKFKALGDFDDLPDHRRFDAANKAAAEWFDHLGRGGSAVAVTVREACARYVQHLRDEGNKSAAADAETRFANYVSNDAKLAETELTRLTPAHLTTWRKALRAMPTRSGPRRGETRSASTENRDLTCVRAALNLAYADALVVSDFAWRKALVPLKNADRRRNLYLDRAQRRRFIKRANSDLSTFLTALCLLPLRPGALAALTVADFDKRLKLLRIGHDKAGGDRKVKLPEATAALFTEAARDKLPAAPLLARANGAAWDKDAWKHPVKAAARAAKLPDETTAYSLRHSTITDLVTDGLDLLTVAQISGTSVVMIERHYGSLRGNIASAALAKLAL